MSGFRDRWNANADRYADDVCLFLEDQWCVRDAPPNMTLGPDNTIRLMEHQREILNTFFERDSGGRLRYDVMLYSTIKKSGKTEIEGGVAEWTALTSPGTPELYFIGNDKEQAQTRAFAAIGMQINPRSKAFNPVVAEQLIAPRAFTPSLSMIPIAAGGFLKSIPIDYAGEAGSAPKASFWDELWGADRESQRRLWDELTPPPTVRDAFRFVATYAGFRLESELLWDLYVRIVGDKPSDRKKRRVHPTLPLYVSLDGNAIAYWDEGIEARRMPWQTPDYYKREKASLRPSAYARLHENRWQDVAEAFISAESWDALPRYVRGDALNPDRLPEYVTVDAAHKRDTTTALRLAYTGLLTATGRPILKLIDKATWRPSKGNVVIPEETALPWVRDAIATGNVKAVGYDANHFETSAELLKREYPALDIRDMSNSSTNLTRQGQALYDAISFLCLTVYDEPDGDPDALRSHVLNAVAVKSSTGWRLSKGKDENKIDGAAALSMGIVIANERGRGDLETRSPIYIIGALDDEDGESG